MSTKLYHNTTEEDMNVLGIGVIPAGEKVSVTSEYPPHVVLENYPGLEEVSDQTLTVDEVKEEAKAEEPETDSDGEKSDVQG